MRASYQDALAYYKIDGAHPGGMALTKKIFQAEKINDQTTILDAGCGTGQTSTYLAKAFRCEVYAIDNHPEMINAASQTFSNENLPIKLFEGTVEHLPFSIHSFDYIIAESSTAFTTIPKSLSEYFRVLKPSGVLLNIDMTIEQPLSQEGKAELIDFYGVTDILREDEWVKAMKMAGFNTVDMLKSNSIFQELEEYEFDEEESINRENNIDYNEKMETVMQSHQKLLRAYGNKIGYRVFRARKLDEIR